MLIVIVIGLSDLQFIAELLRAEGASAEPHNFENLVPINLNVSVHKSVRQAPYLKK